MLFLFIVLLWMVCIMSGAALLFSARLRFLSSYILLGSTAGLVLSFVFSLLFLFVAAKLVGGTSADGIAALVSLAGFLLGGVAAVIGGLFLARKVNRRLGWE